MKKLYSILFGFFIVYVASGQQQILLLAETFESGTNTFNSATGGVGTNTGNNRWIINDVYTGTPNTPPQDSIVSGQINGAPFSNYLHIHNAGGGSPNASWNTTTPSDRFTFIGSPFCTLGMTDVIFTFFWLCEGDSNAYGEVYYRIDGGAWTKTGLPKYNSQSKWKYEIIQDTAFENVQNLQLGFRWVNAASGIPANVSFGIDDIIAVGTYDNVNNPVNLNITSVSPLTVCQDGFVTIGYDLSAPLCDGTYRIQLSDATGNFSTPIDGGVFSIFAPDTSGFIGFQVPDNVSGSCFKIRINRISPEPQIVGQGSVCFTIVDCPESINTTGAPVMNDLDTTCIQSVIDVKFNSFGVFGPGLPNPSNIYRAQLSDTNGSFASPYQLGTLPSDESFPGPPGNISGLIPANVPPGCGYYIRVISSSPAVTGSLIGPFCLTQCDELTNNTQDIQVCLNGSTPYPDSALLNIRINRWNNDASYDTCNDWRIELRSMMDFSLVNIGALGVYHDSLGGNFVIDFPPFEQQLVAMGVQPGAYYMRIRSDCSNLPWNETGSVVRITIGAPDTSRPQIILADTVYCNLGLVSLFVSPFQHPPSDYEWAANGINNGDPFIWPFNPLLVDFTGAPLNDYIFYVREINFGCTGAFSDKATITIIGSPNVNITGDTSICFGDTVTYNVGYLKETYYNWDVPEGVTLFDESNSQVTMVFNTIGTFTISNFSLNDCGFDSGKYTVNVYSPYNVNLGPDKDLCFLEPITLQADLEPVPRLFTTTETSTIQGRQGAMFNIVAHEDVVIDSFAVKYMAGGQSVQQEIWGKTGTYRGFEQTQPSWNLIGAYNNFTSNPPNRFTHIPIPVNQAIAKDDTFAFYVTTINSTAVNMQYSNGLGLAQEVVYKSDGVIDYVQGSINTYFFGASTGPRVLNCRIYYTSKAGIKYLWNTGDTTTTIIFNPDQTKEYTVDVYDTSGCRASDTVLITIKPLPTVSVGPDTTFCAQTPYQINGNSTEQNFTWTPASGLSDSTVLNPAFVDVDTTTYILSSTGPNGCVARDTIVINVIPLPDAYAGPDTAICDGFAYIIPATSTQSNFQWTPTEELDDPGNINPSFIGNKTSTYILIVPDADNRCTKRDTVTIKVGTYASLDAGPDKDICTQETYVMEAASNGKTFVWSPATGLSDSTVLNPVFTGTDAGDFIYYITTSDSIGCLVVDSVKLKVISCFLNIPQAFTPNADGVNDIFNVFGNLKEYEIRIFNRWGEMVYTALGSNELCSGYPCPYGWDGTYKGKLQELGTFAYFITGQDYNDKKVERKGNLTLIR
ncbi:MAG: gliding motility-associated C-terminal domain-containing protein [Bacteroidota bacterium]